MNLKVTQLRLAQLAFFTGLSIFCQLGFAIDIGVAETPLTDKLKYKDSWSFSLTPYFWLAALGGHANLHGTRVVFSTPISRTRHDLDVSIGARFEASTGPWAFLLDPDYVKVTQSTYSRPSNAKSTYESIMTDGGVYYQILDYASRGQSEPLSSLELLAAARVVSLHTSVQFLNNQTQPQSDTSCVVVPLIGARLKYNATPKIHTWLSADFGGLEVGHVSSTWSASLGASFQVVDYLALSLGYKALGINYSKEAITINTLLQGPVLALTLSY